MLVAHEVRRLNWHPLRDVQRGGRPENYALSVWSGPPGQPLRYLMACGHPSLPRLTLCERGCRTAPAWRQPLRRSEPLAALSKWSERYSPETLAKSSQTRLVRTAKALGARHGYGFVPRQVA